MAPEWQGMLNKTISENMKKDKDAISYAIATIGPDGGPKTRYILHRGMVNERRKEDDPSSNKMGDDDSLVGEALLSTTDIRSPKAQQLTKNDKVEIAWWFAPSGDQYRITGRAFLVGRPDHDITKSFLEQHGKRLAPSAIKGDFDWEDERKRIFDKISPAIRASFVRPTPGEPLKASEQGSGGSGKDHNPSDWPLELKPDDDKELVEKSYRNFALLVIEPHTVDWCQLNEQPNKRSIFKKDASSGSWSKTDVAP